MLTMKISQPGLKVGWTLTPELSLAYSEFILQQLSFRWQSTRYSMSMLDGSKLLLQALWTRACEFLYFFWQTFYR
jgi:hypothetical protein